MTGEVKEFYSTELKQHGINPASSCSLFSEFVTDFAALEHLNFPSAHTVLCIVADARNVHADTLSRLAERFLVSGLIYVCVWGPDCERVHDIFDEVHVGDGGTEPAFTFMSTWHADERVEEALWFFLQCAFPPDTPIETTSYVAVTVGKADWATRVENALSDLPAFKACMINEDCDSSGDA